MGLVLSANLGKNLNIAVNHPISRCISLMFVGLLISIMALHFQGWPLFLSM